MGWTTIIEVIAKYGLPLAESLWKKWTVNAEPTQADWDELKLLVSKTPTEYMKEALVRANISFDSELGMKLLNAVK